MAKKHYITQLIHPLIRISLFSYFPINAVYTNSDICNFICGEVSTFGCLVIFNRILKNNSFELAEGGGKINPLHKIYYLPVRNLKTAKYSTAFPILLGNSYAGSS